MKKEDEIFKNVTRYTTADERKNIKRIDVNPDDVENVMELIRNGLIEAAGTHDAAVQDNMALSAEFTVRLSRPVYNESDDSVEELVGKRELKTTIRAKKIYK